MTIFTINGFGDEVLKDQRLKDKNFIKVGSNVVRIEDDSRHINLHVLVDKQLAFAKILCDSEPNMLKKTFEYVKEFKETIINNILEEAKDQKGNDIYIHIVEEPEFEKAPSNYPIDCYIIKCLAYFKPYNEKEGN